MYPYPISTHTGSNEKKTSHERRHIRKARLLALATEEFSPDSIFAREFLSLLNSPPVKLNLIKQTFDNYPNLSSKILRLYNTYLFSQHQRVLDIEEISVFLGCDGMKTIALTCFLMDLARNWLCRADLRRFWHHSILTAIISERIAHSLSHFQDSELFNRAYLGGLFHDVGMLPLLVVAAEENAVCADSCSFSWGSSLAGEKKCFGLNHCDVARLMGQLWDFFPGYSDIITYHHCPDRSPHNRHLVGIVAAADIICETHFVQPACVHESHRVLNSSSRDDMFALCFPEMEPSRCSDLIEALQMELLHLSPLFEFETDQCVGDSSLGLALE